MEKQKLNQTAVLEFFAKYWVVMFLVIISICFGLLEPAFFRVQNIINILANSCIVGLAGMGLTCISAAGEIDFAAGAELSCGCVAMMMLFNRTGLKNYYVALIIVLGIMILYGLLNSFVHNTVGIPAFIATMGTSYLVSGILKSFTNGKTLNGGKLWPAEYTFLGQKYLWGVIPVSIILLLAVAAVMLILTEFTRHGKYIYSVGVNAKACKYLGIDAKKQKRIGFILCSLLCGLAGILQTSMLNGGSAELGDSILMNALTVLMIGAVFIKKGVYNIPGTLVASVLLSVIENGLTMIGAQAYVKEFVYGAILLAAVSIVAVVRQRAIVSAMKN